MMRRSYAVLFAVLILLCTVSCRKKAETDSTPMTFRTVTLKKSHPFKEKAGQPLMEFNLSIQYPVSYPDEFVLDRVRKTILRDFHPDLRDTLNEPEAVLEAFAKEKTDLFDLSDPTDLESLLPEAGSKSQATWWDRETMIIRLNDKGLLSYTIESDQYTGGAHGGKFSRNTLIELKTGDILKEGDLFAETALPLINEIILKKIEQQNNVESTDELEQIGFFDLAQIGQYRNFYLTEKGIVYLFNEAEIAAYALGTIEVALPWEEIQGFLLPESPLKALTKN